MAEELLERPGADASLNAPNCEWNQDLEWVFLHSCFTLTDEDHNGPDPGGGPGYPHWRPTLGGRPRRAHGLLGADDAVLTNLNMGIEFFWDYLDPSGSQHATYIDAYQLAMQSMNEEWVCYYHTSNGNDKLDELTPDNAEENPEYTYVDCEGTHFVEMLEDSGTTFRFPGGDACLVQVELSGIKGAGSIMPRYVVAERVFPSLRHDFPINTSTYVSARGDSIHIGHWNIAGQSCSYTTEIAQTVASGFVERELSSIVDRIRWLCVSPIRWGRHRADEPLVLQTAGYAVVGELTYGDIPLVNDKINVTLLGDQVEFVSLTCHDVVEISSQSVIVAECSAALERGWPDIRRAIGRDDAYALVAMRLVYAAFPDRDQVEATAHRYRYHPAWAVTIQSHTDRPAFGKKRIVYLDAASGEYIAYSGGIEQ